MIKKKILGTFVFLFMKILLHRWTCNEDSIHLFHLSTLLQYVIIITRFKFTSLKNNCCVILKYCSEYNCKKFSFID